jgi:PPOX class probable F420-dependent enzyme
MPAPSVPSTHTDLLDASVATIATVGPDGRPQVSAVWFLTEDGVVKVSLNVARQKTKNLAANPAVTVFILDPANPARYVEIRGDATLDPDDDYAFASRLGGKYGGADLRAMDGPDGRRVVVTVDPVRINAIDLSAG